VTNDLLINQILNFAHIREVFFISVENILRASNNSMRIFPQNT